MSEFYGVGDDDTSYAYDGARVCKWHDVYEDWGENWKAGDVVGTLIDLDLGVIYYWLNDKCLGIAF